MTDDCDLAELLFCIAFDNASEETKALIEQLLNQSTKGESCEPF